MFATRVLIGLFEFVFSVFMLGAGIYMVYKVVLKANPDFDMGREIKKGNTAVGTLVAAILFSVCWIIHHVLFSVVSMFRMMMTGTGEAGVSLWQIPLIAAGHIVMALILAMFTISVTLRMFGKLTTEMKEGELLKQGNMAVGILLSAVVLVASMFVGEGVSALSKALTPQPSVGKVRVLK